jgi:CheY-like chemotaxis protein
MRFFNPRERQSDLKPIGPRDTRVLIVEDSPTDAMLERQALETFGIREFTFVKSSEEALQLLARRSFNVALIDYNLPRMDGLGLLERMRDMAPDMRVIVVTGAHDEKVAVAAMKLGAADYVSKDNFLTAGIFNTLQNALRDIQEERNETLTTGGDVEAGLAETAWLLEAAAGSYQAVNDVRSPREQGRYLDIIEAMEHFLRTAEDVFPGKAVQEEERVVWALLSQGLSPRDAVLIWRDALTSLRGQEIRCQPTLLLAGLMKRLVEEYQTQLALATTERSA